MQEYKLQIAGLVLRCVTGTLFLFQGYDKLFRLGIRQVTDTFVEDARRYHVPRSFVLVMSCYTSLAEFAGGALLIAGVFTNYALFALGVDLMLVVFAFSFIDPMWDLRFVFPRLIFILILLLLPEEAHQLSFDYLFQLKP